MENFVEARTRVANKIAERFADEPAVTGVLCAGSTGRGHADRWSDLEIGVIWSRPPTEPERRQVAHDLAMADVRLSNYDESERSWFDEWWFDAPAGDGLLVEVCHLTAEGAHTQLDRLLLHDDPDPYALTFAAALVYGRPLAGSIESLVERVHAYPRSLAVAVVRRHGQVDQFWRWQMFVERHNPHGLRRHFAGVVDALIHMTCALNGRWWPGPKWPGWTLAGLSIAAPNLSERLVALDQQDPPVAAAALGELVEETYDLVAVHLPEADQDRLRRIFHFARAPWPRQ
ncbi:hypothetical protein [Actinopolymorpha rutila]|uniref:Putative nucleotidyltransferase n=1 Tax=Actinopolymorpha rutila TaxID=446787 RepID=A0A852Z707_9ACTN|nr:hypothetical protein [Actinopolymorpha rutila]NYH87995.1 putative nucleotidyltransferase [Actinopolymorpha rutila]